MATNPGSEAFVRDLLSGSYVERDILKEVSGATKEYWEANLRAAMRLAGGLHEAQAMQDGLALPRLEDMRW